MITRHFITSGADREGRRSKSFDASERCQSIGRRARGPIGLFFVDRLAESVVLYG
jgi:hypothetical protein